MRTVLSSLADVPEALHGEYEEKDGKFVLKIDGDVPGMAKSADLTEANDRIKEFRDTNIGLRQKLEKLEEQAKKFDGFDPAEYTTLKVKLAELEKQAGGDDVTLMMQKAIEKAVTPLQEELAENKREKQLTDAKLDKKELESVLTLEGLKAGISDKAMKDYIRRGGDVFSYKEGKPVAMNGETPLFSERKPSEPLPVSEWILSLAKEAPHLFKQSKGGGAQGGTDGDTTGATYDPNDDADFLKNLDKIAKAEMVQRE